VATEHASGNVFSVPGPPLAPYVERLGEVTLLGFLFFASLWYLVDDLWHACRGWLEGWW
jgi:hypothetical protein